MKIIIKTLQQKQFPVEVDSSDSILKVKERIGENEEAGRIPVERQKLIHAGKVLENETLLSATAIKDGDFVVLMTISPRTVSSAVSSTVTPVTSAQKKQPATVTTQISSGTAPAANLPESTLVTGEDYEAAVNRLVDMGFAKDQVMVAMRASFNNPERAVEYLATGIFPEQPDLAGEEDAMEADGDGAMEDDMEDAVEGGSEALRLLRNDPQFRQLRALIQQNPQMLGPMIEQLGQSSPDLLQLIDQNREEFYSLLMEPIGESEGEELPEGVLNESTSGAQILEISPADHEAITRLESMGFDHARVVEAFFACDKSEELAANYLVEHMNDQD